MYFHGSGPETPMAHLPRGKLSLVIQPAIRKGAPRPHRRPSPPLHPRRPRSTPVAPSTPHFRGSPGGTQLPPSLRNPSPRERPPNPRIAPASFHIVGTTRLFSATSRHVSRET